MKILFIGDVMGRSGRDAVILWLPKLKSHFKPDVIIVNAENAAHGRGVTKKICADLYEAGTDVITTGNHVWAQREIFSFIDQDKKIVRPLNFPKGTQGKGYVIHALPDGRKTLVVNVLGRVFMEALDDPFAALDTLTSEYKLGRDVHAIFIDFHAEATSEKMAAAHYLDGRVSALIGTHTHIPTADAMILSDGTAYMSDAGMSGDYNSVIGVKKDAPIQRFVKQIMTKKMEPADGEATVSGVMIETNDINGLASSITPVRVGGILNQTHDL